MGAGFFMGGGVNEVNTDKQKKKVRNWNMLYLLVTLDPPMTPGPSSASVAANNDGKGLEAFIISTLGGEPGGLSPKTPHPHTLDMRLGILTS